MLKKNLKTNRNGICLQEFIIKVKMKHSYILEVHTNYIVVRSYGTWKFVLKYLGDTRVCVRKTETETEEKERD